MAGTIGTGETGGPGIGTPQPGGIMNSLVKYGSVKEFGEIVGDIAGTEVKIFAGEDMGTSVSGIIEGTTTGFKAGVAVASVVGTAGLTLGSLVIPGGAIIAGITILGGILGAIEGGIKAQEKRFDSLNSYVGGQLDAAEAAERESLQRGIAIRMADTEGLYYQAETANALFQTMLDTAKGAGYAGQRARDTDGNRDAYIDHGLDDAMEAMETAIGQSEAFLVGLGEDYQREATALLINGQETAPDAPLYDGKSAERLRALHEQYAALTEELKQITDEAGGLTDPERAAEIGLALKTLKTETAAIAEDRYHGSEFSLKTRDAELLLTAGLQRDARDADHSWDEDYNRSQVLGGANPEEYISIKREQPPPFHTMSWTDEGGNLHNPPPGTPGYFDDGGNFVLMPEVTVQPTVKQQIQPSPFHTMPWRDDGGNLHNPPPGTPGYFDDGGNFVLMPGFPVQLKAEGWAQREAGPRERVEQTVNITFPGPITIREEADLDKIARKLAQGLREARLLAVPR